MENNKNLEISWDWFTKKVSSLIILIFWILASFNSIQIQVSRCVNSSHLAAVRSHWSSSTHGVTRNFLESFLSKMLTRKTHASHYPPKGHMDISIERSKSNSERCLKEGNEERRIHFVEIRRKQSSEKGKDEITTRWGSTLWSDVVKNVQSVGSVHWCLIFCTLGTWVRQGCLCVVNIEHDDEIPYRHKVAEWRNKNHRNLQAL